MDLHTAVSVSMLPVSRGRAAAFFKELTQQDPAPTLEHLLDALGVAREASGGMKRQAEEAAGAALAAGARAGFTPVPWFDDRYPSLLGCIPDPPPVLWVRGDAAVLERPAVAIVGSRAATTYALEVGARLAAELVSRDIVVVSGLARGVDSSAHRGCLEAGGQTVAVLGSGLDRIYPAEHKPLADIIARQGAVVSELGPGGPPLAEHFPLRNRIISGISLGVVVVEASENSGSLITARCALEQGRDVMAVPGSILTGRNRGSHSLLKDGAKVIETADDILEELGWPGASRNGAGPGPGTLDPLSETAGGSRKSLKTDPLLAAMEPGEVYRLDELVEATGIGATRLLPRLMELELLGRIAVAGGGRFTRVPPGR